MVLSLFFAAHVFAAAELRRARDLIVFHAGSLSVPVKQMVVAFKKGHPDVNIILESAGSRTCARKISDLHKPCDVFASADYTVIDSLLIPEHAGWAIKFASNEMAIVYHDASRKSREINSHNWHEILLDEGVAVGRSDPDSDPCGYRAVLTMKLAEKYYQKGGLADRLIRKKNTHIRPKETDLLALLEAGEIDYIFLYRSVAEQHGLKYLALPDEINLKNPQMESLYGTVTTTLAGETPGTTIEQRGEAMVYGVTIPRSAPNPGLALSFVSFMLEKEKGLKIMEQHGQPPVVPMFTPTFKAIPEELKKYAKEK
ncbi:MAG: tungstate ABC transporter substrate-binding protein WtpA [Deltaproteobacteria bacterium]|nr:tungstate ABC transporter substrate-binding protein WtpA [Deltaproteobacteria bacterium]